MRGPTEREPEGPPAVKPVPVQESALVEFQESVEDCPWSIVEGEAERVAVGVNVQVGGLGAPFAQGQTCVLQDWELAPEQVAPPYCGAGLVQVRVWVPPPQETEQAPQSVHPPLMGAFVTTMEPEADEVLPAAFVQVNVHVAFPAGQERGPELYEVLGAGTGWSVQLPE